MGTAYSRTRAVKLCGECHYWRATAKRDGKNGERLGDCEKTAALVGRGQFACDDHITPFQWRAQEQRRS